MTEEKYIALTNFCRKTKFRENAIVFFCKYSPISVIFIYSITICYLAIIKSPKLFLFIILPAIDLAFISVLRKILNKPRPYDKLNYEPLGKYKRGKGQSFPSRHTASAFIIGMACLYINKPYGILMLILAVLIAASRIISGVHYPKDVLAGGSISLVLGYIGFFLV